MRWKVKWYLKWQARQYADYGIAVCQNGKQIRMQINLFLITLQHQSKKENAFLLFLNSFIQNHSDSRQSAFLCCWFAAYARECGEIHFGPKQRQHRVASTWPSLLLGATEHCNGARVAGTFLSFESSHSASMQTETRCSFSAAAKWHSQTKHKSFANFLHKVIVKNDYRHRYLLLSFPLSFSYSCCHFGLFCFFWLLSPSPCLHHVLRVYVSVETKWIIFWGINKLKFNLKNNRTLRAK